MSKMTKTEEAMFVKYVGLKILDAIEVAAINAVQQYPGMDENRIIELTEEAVAGINKLPTVKDIQNGCF